MSDDLIKRLENATGPNRELDRAIHDFINSTDWTKTDFGPVAYYTASIDAALTLVPEGFAADVCAYSSGTGDAHIWGLERNQVRGSTHGHIKRPATPAIALCIAALRARGAIAAKTDPSP